MVVRGGGVGGGWSVHSVFSSVFSVQLKGTLSPKLIFSYMKDITFIKTVHMVKNSLMPFFS